MARRHSLEVSSIWENPSQKALTWTMIIALILKNKKQGGFAGLGISQAEFITIDKIQTVRKSTKIIEVGFYSRQFNLLRGTPSHSYAVLKGSTLIRMDENSPTSRSFDNAVRDGEDSSVLARTWKNT